MKIYKAFVGTTCITILIVLSVVVVNGQEKSKLTYNLSGEIVGLPDGVPLYLIRISNGDTIETAKSRQGVFKMDGEYENEGEMHFLKFDSSGLGLPRMRTWIQFYFEDQPIRITGFFSQWPNLMISGSPSTIVYNEIFGRLDIYAKEMKQKRVGILTGDSAAKEHAIDEFRSKYLAIYREYPDAWASADLARATISFTYSDLVTLYDNLTPRVRDSYPGRMLKERVEQRKPNNLVRKDNIIPDFVITDSLGNDMQIRNLLKNSKFTLIDFWASWCSPCIDGMPMLKAVLGKFDRKDFQIIGVSIDNSKAAWLKSLKEIDSNWEHAIDQHGKSAKSYFGMSSIPAYLLVDQDGRMIAYYCALSEVRSFGPVINDSNELERLVSSLVR